MATAKTIGIMKKALSKKFDYGDAVKVSEAAPETFFPAQVGDVCGIDQIYTLEDADENQCNIGSWIYTIEFPNGSSMQIPECYLQEDTNRLKYRIGEKIQIKPPNLQQPNSAISVTIIDYRLIDNEQLAKNLNVELDSFVYLVKDDKNNEFLVSDSSICNNK